MSQRHATSWLIIELVWPCTEPSYCHIQVGKEGTTIILGDEASVPPYHYVPIGNEPTKRQAGMVP